MKFENEREKIIKYCQKMVKDGLTKGTGGNISICDKNQKIMAITPSGIDYFEMEPKDIVIIDVESGKIIEGDKVPSSELDMHRIFYKYRKGIKAVVHTHSKFATAVSCTSLKGLPAIDYLLAVAGVDVPCAEYATYGTVKFVKNAFNTMEDRKAVLLSNHGMIAVGENLEEAYNIAENVEFCSEIFCISKSIGTPKILSEKEMLHMIDRFKNYGKRIEEHDEI